MNGKKSKSKKFIYNFIYKKATSAQPNVDQALSGESKNKKITRLWQNVYITD